MFGNGSRQARSLSESLAIDDLPVNPVARTRQDLGKDTPGLGIKHDLHSRQVYKARSPYEHGRITGPVQVLHSLMELWGLSRDEVVVLLGLDITETGYVDALFQGKVSLRGRDQKDRIAYLLQIHAILDSVFQDPNAEARWLRESKDALNGVSPRAKMLEGSMESLLAVKQLTEVFGGR